MILCRQSIPTLFWLVQNVAILSKYTRAFFMAWIAPYYRPDPYVEWCNIVLATGGFCFDWWPINGCQEEQRRKWFVSGLGRMLNNLWQTSWIIQWEVCFGWSKLTSKTYRVNSFRSRGSIRSLFWVVALSGSWLKGQHKWSFFIC